MKCGDTVFVRVRALDDPIEACVVMISENGRSIALAFDGGLRMRHGGLMVGAAAAMRDDDGSWHEIMTGEPLTIEPVVEHAADATTVDRMAEEMKTITEPMGLMLVPTSALDLVGLVQLALRHPEIANAESERGVRKTARNFIEAAREYFADKPAILYAIERGDE